MSNGPSLLRYARYHGLCYDYRKDHPFHKLDEIDLFDNSSALPELPDFIPLHVEPPTDWKLRLSQQASKLLVFATTQPRRPKWRDVFSDHRKLHQRKVEQPLLLTDHEKDVRKFLPKLGIKVEGTDFPLEALNEEKDEGLSWPTDILKFCGQCDTEIVHEKLQVSRDSLKLLHHTLRDPWSEDDQKGLVKELLMFKRKQIRERILPPLMTEGPVLEPYVPSSPAVRLLMTSEPASLTSLLTNSPPRGKPYEDYIPFEEDTPPEVDLPEHRPRYFKYHEDNLMNHEIVEPSSSTVTEGKIRADEDVKEHNPGYDFASTRSLISHVSVPKLIPYSFSQKYRLPSLPIADDTVIFSKEEKINKLSTTPRSPLYDREACPDKSVPISTKLEILVSDILHGVRIPTDLNLLSDRMEGKGYQPQISENVIRSHQMLWKPDKLSLLRKDDNEENLVLELSANVCEKGKEDILNIKEGKTLDPKPLSNHSQQIIEKIPQALLANIEQEASPVMLPIADVVVVPKKRKPLEEIVNDAKRQNVAATSAISKFSASGSVSSFMYTRHDKKTTCLEEPESSEEQTEMLVPETSDTVTTATSSTKTFIAGLESSRTIIFSINHLQLYSSLLRFFEAWPGDNLNVIYRELDIPMLLSPKHAVIITTLQALTQRPLPGQGSGAKSAIHDQVSVLSRESSLEVLIVLISTPSFALSDQTTMLSFSAYCDTISQSSTCYTQPIYIPSGQTELHSWVTKLLHKYAFHTQDMIFLDGATVWERFLVKAGMNPFAAQVLLGLWKEHDRGGVWDLRAFVQMNPAERHQRFESIVGGHVLETVSRRIDGGTGSGILV